MRLIICTDESISKGSYFSNFFGGVAVWEHHLPEVVKVLERAKAEAGLGSEMKWSKCSHQYVDAYEEVMDRFFELVGQGRVKIRIMFTQNRHIATGLTTEQRRNTYFLLYYQFLKHAFGLRYAAAETVGLELRFLLDQMPGSGEIRRQFKAFLAGLEEWPSLRRFGVRVPVHEIAEVDSKRSVAHQALDVVLGSMQFRLNDKHKEKPSGQRTRARKTIAKEKLYRAINRKVRAIRPGFNVGISTGLRDDPTNHWRDPYRHWLFVPKGHRVEAGLSKRRKR